MIDANDLERMAKERPDECFLKGSGVLKLTDGIRQIERKIREAERAHLQTIGERDRYCEWADKLADAIAEHFGIEIGEHSAGFEANNPWANALEHIQNAPPAPGVLVGDGTGQALPPLPDSAYPPDAKPLADGVQEGPALESAAQALYLAAARADSARGAWLEWGALSESERQIWRDRAAAAAGVTGSDGKTDPRKPPMAGEVPR